MFSQSDGTPSSLCSMYAAISLRMHSTPGLALYDPVTETHALALIKRLLQQNTEYGSTVSQLPENCMICNNRGLWMLSNRYTVNWVLYIVLYHGLNQFEQHILRGTNAHTETVSSAALQDTLCSPFRILWETGAVHQLRECAESHHLHKWTHTDKTHSYLSAVSECNLKSLRANTDKWSLCMPTAYVFPLKSQC